MQYYTPGCGISNGGQLFPGYPFLEAQQSGPYPQVIGEGDVVSVALPDGSIQLYFVPSPRCPSGPHAQPYGSLPNTPWTCNPEAWFIRSVPDPYLASQSSVQNQQYQRVTGIPSFLQNRYEYKPSYQLKFHNDNGTSTTDIHYFYPSLRYCEWFPRQCAATQVEQPFSSPRVSLCSKPCHCTKNCGVSSWEPHQRLMATKKKQVTYRDSQTSCSSAPSVEVIHKKQKKSARLSRRKSKNHECECDLPPRTEKSNKGITTVTDQAAGCCAEGRDTQTSPASRDTCAPIPVQKASSFLNVKYAETEFWYPKTPQSKRIYSDNDGAMSCESDSSHAFDERGASGSDE